MTEQPLLDGLNLFFSWAVFGSTGLTLGVLNTASYTIIVLVAIVTSLMAAPVLRVAMARVDATALTDVAGGPPQPFPGIRQLTSPNRLPTGKT